VFHGVAIPWLLYPLFHLFGWNFFSSLISGLLLSLASFVVFPFLILKHVTKNVNLSLSILSLAWSLALLWFPPAQLLIESNNANLALRSLPLLVVSYFFLVSDRMVTHKRFLWFGALIWLAFLIDVSSAISMMVALCAYVCLFLKDSLVYRTKIIVGFFVSAWISFFGAASLFSGWNPLSVLGYMFVSIPSDQFWYFWWPPNPFIGDIHGFIEFVSISAGLKWLIWMGIIGLTALMWFWILILLYKKPWKVFLAKWSLVEFSFFSLLSSLIAGCVPFIGIASPHYFFPFLRIFWFILIVILIHGIWRKKADLLSKRTAYLSLFLSLMTIPWIVFGVKSINETLANRGSFVCYSELGNCLGGTYVDTWKMVNLLRGGTLWSTYASILEILRWEHQVSGYDYIIHALWEEKRNEYVSKFRLTQPQYVQTIRPNFFVGYEYWLQVTTWNFYRELFEKYTPIFVSRYSVIWEKSEKNTEPVNIPCFSDSSHIKLTSPDIGIVSVQIEYSTNPKIKIPILSNLSRTLLIPEWTWFDYGFSIPENQKTWTFPLFMKEKGDIKVAMVTKPSFFKSVHIAWCSAKFIPLNKEQIWVVEEHKESAGRFIYKSVKD
jgi:hypothetical protein